MTKYGFTFISWHRNFKYNFFVLLQTTETYNFFTTTDMLKYFLTLLTFSGFLSGAFAQLTTTNASSAEQVVESLIGSGITVFNVQAKGAYGLFSNGASSINIEDGVIIATGDINNAIGPNLNNSMSGSTGSGGDNDLAGLIGEPASNLNDAAVIEFDFIPQEDEISVKYVFGSDEYPEYVCSSFNDAFAFIVSGPGINGSVNIAQIPGSGIPVSINNVNDNTGTCSEPGNEIYFVENYAGTGAYNVQYDGFTVPLEAKLSITPCETYHIKLVVADVGDGAYDSGVFLEKGSFTSGNVNVTSVSFSERFEYAIEGCNNNAFIFTRDENLELPLSVKLEIGGSATNGIDYTTIADSLYFAENEDSVTFNIVPLLDSVSDPIEFITVAIDDGCKLDEDVDTIFIREFFDLTDSVYQICLGDGVQLNADYIFPDDQFVWTPSSGLSCDSCQSPYASPSNTTMYHVDITEPSSGCMGKDSIEIQVLEYPDLNLTGNTLLCNEPNTELTVSTGLDETVNLQWFLDEGVISSGTHTNQSVSQTGNYFVVGDNQSLCYDTSNVHFVEFIHITVDAGEDQTIVYGEVTNMTAASNLNVNPTWTTERPESLSSLTDLYAYAAPTATTTYTLTDEYKGCKATDEMQIQVRLFVPTAISPNGDGANDAWEILGLNELLYYEIAVRNRYGNVVYNCHNNYEPWNGIRNGQELPVGTYYYTINTPDQQEYAGSLTIMR